MNTVGGAIRSRAWYMRASDILNARKARRTAREFTSRRQRRDSESFKARDEAVALPSQVMLALMALASLAGARTITPMTRPAREGARSHAARAHGPGTEGDGLAIGSAGLRAACGAQTARAARLELRVADR